MKKFLSIATGLSICATAFSINIIPGWQLVGTEHDINISTFKNSNIKSVWAWDKENKKWKAYIPNKNINLEQYGIEPLTKINAKDGFWINASKNLIINDNQGSDINLSKGLIAWYKFDGNTKDSSNYEYSGIEHGNVKYVDGVIGKAVYLQDPNSYITINKHINNLNDFTVSFFVNIDRKASEIKSTASPDNVFLSGANSIHDNEMLLYWNKFDDLKVELANNQKSSGKTYDLRKKWTFLTYVKKNGIVKLYVNGKLFSTYDFSSVENLNIENLIIGKDQDCLGGCFADNQSLLGKMDELRIYNRALNKNEIDALYNLREKKSQ